MIRALALVAALVFLAGCVPEAKPDASELGQAVKQAIAFGTRSFDHSPLDKIMAGVIKSGLVDYRKLQAARPALDAYLESVAKAPLAALAKNEAYALLINAYNALTLRSILDHPQVKGIKEISGVWDKQEHRVGGFTCTLDQLEHKILRPLFTDPRVHFAINCASRSCAPLPPFAYAGAKLDSQLDERRARFLTDPANVNVAGDRLAVSSYFDWFKADFTTPGWRGSAATVPAYIRPHATPEVRAFIDQAGGNPNLKILPYDWSLNAQVPPDPAVAGKASGGNDGFLATQARRVRDLTSGYGFFGSVLFGVIYVVAVVCLIPAGPLTIAAGAAYGLAGGFALVSICSTLGAILAFLLGRYLLREKVRARLDRWPAFANIDRAVEREGWKMVALARLSPVMPYSVLNYALGVTGVKLVPYAVASWLGMMPGTLLYVAAGAVSVDVATGGASTGLKIAGVVATALGIWWITRAAKGKLEAKEPASA